MSTMQKRNAKKVDDLDALYPPAQIAKWMGLSKRNLLELASDGKIPVIRLNKRVVRFNPRSILKRVA